jgi:hypothetical protein
MITSSLFSRKDLKVLIKNSPKTKDGYYYFPRFKSLLVTKGKIRDHGFIYDRSYFNKKMVFTDEDINAFMSKRKTYDIDYMRYRDNKLADVLSGLEFLELNDYVFDYKYTIEELIDNTLFICKYKY